MMLNKLLYRFCSRVKIDKDCQYLYGINSVQIALNTNRRKLYELYITDSEGSNLSSRVANIMNKGRKIGLPVHFLPKEKMERFCPKQPHQNVVLKCDKLEYITLESPKELDNQRLCVFLDQITDPQNFGAIIRSCYYFNVDSLIVAEKNKCPLNSTVSKTSSGALELINVSCVKHSVEFFQEWKSLGNKVICTGMPESNNKVSMIYLDQYHQKIQNQNVLLVVGSEGFGVSPHLTRLADHILSIRKNNSNAFPGSLVDSLNVNAATAIILFELQRK